MAKVLFELTERDVSSISQQQMFRKDICVSQKQVD